MTPGFAKSRKELFWLPYPEPDKVIINAHNFTPATFDPSVNGKTPSAVWCPSRDTAGNGTLTLSDLIGSHPVTLTNMDATTDWVADTDAGGVRAVDFDGSNDYGAIGSWAPISTASPHSFSAWIKSRPISGSRYPTIVLLKSNAGRFGFGFSSDPLYLGLLTGSADATWGRFRNGLAASTWSNVWRHVVFTYDGVSPTSASSFRFYMDGSLSGTVSTALAFGTTTDASLMAADTIGTNNSRFDGLLDDVRLWAGTLLDASDVTALYASGVGRGKSA